MNCTTKANRAHTYYCITDQLSMLRIEQWGSNAKKLPDGDSTQGAY